MSEKEIKEIKKQYGIGSHEYHTATLRDMVNSVWCYDHYGRDYEAYLSDDFITNYYKDTDYYGTGKARLTKDEVERIVKEQVDYLEENCYIEENVYTDSDGISYNNIIDRNEVA